MSDYTHDIKREENARIILTVNVPQEIVSSTYNKTINEISKKAIIKGFRKGKVPITVLEQKFGDSIRIEATEKIIQDAISEVLASVEYKPLPYSRPELKHDEQDSPSSILINSNAPFSFSIEYDSTPNIEVGNITNFTLEEPVIKIDENDIARELKQIQERNIFTKEKEGEIVDGDTVNYETITLDEHNNEIAGSQHKNITTTIGDPESDMYDLASDLKGMKKNDAKTISKTYKNNYKDELFAGKTLILKIKVTKVSIKDIPEIDDELAQDVDDKFKTLNALKTHLNTQLEERAKLTVENLHKKEILNYLLKKSKLEIPKSAVAYQQESSWKQFVQQYGGDEQNILKGLQQSGNTKELLLEHWKENAIKQVGEQLLISKLIEKEEINISDEDVEIELKKELDKSDEETQKILDYYKQNNFMSQIKYDFEQKKLFELLKNRTIIKKGKPISLIKLEEYVQEENNKSEEHESE